MFLLFKHLNRIRSPPVNKKKTNLFLRMHKNFITCNYYMMITMEKEKSKLTNNCLKKNI